jgi:O-antigen ligase
LLTAVITIFVLTPAIVRTIEGLKRLLIAILIAYSPMIMVSLGGIFGIHSMVMYKGGLFALRGLFSNANSFGIASLITLLLSLIIQTSFMRSGSRRVSLYNIMFTVSLIALAISNSRGSWVGAIAALLVYLFYKNRKAWQWTSLALLILGSIYHLISQWIFRILRLSSSLKYGIFGDRTQLYMYAIRVFPSIPPLGLGIGNQSKIYEVSKVPLPSSFPSCMIGLGFHDSYIESIFELGFIGFLLFLLPIGITILRTLKFIRRPQLSKEISHLTIGLLALSIALLVSGFFESTLVLPGSHSFLVFWLTISLLNILPRVAREELKKKEAS